MITLSIRHPERFQLEQKRTIVIRVDACQGKKEHAFCFIEMVAFYNNPEASR
jgi:hypothetical protein